MPPSTEKTIAVLGAGAMGGSIARGLVASHTVDAAHVLACDPSQDRLDSLALLGIQTFASAQDMLAGSLDVLVVAVKPQVLPAVLEDVADKLEDRLVISIAAGVSLETLTELVPSARLVRALPNLPVQVLSGATALCLGDTATPQDGELAVALFSCLGSAHVMREDQLDAEGAVVSCGPAYVALFVDLMVRAAVEHGMTAPAAREMVLSTICGVSRQLLGSGDHPRAYMERVTSPGGTTAAGLRAMEPILFDAIERGVDAALERTGQLADKGRA